MGEFTRPQDRRDVRRAQPPKARAAHAVPGRKARQVRATPTFVTQTWCSQPDRAFPTRFRLAASKRRYTDEDIQLVSSRAALV